MKTSDVFPEATYTTQWGFNGLECLAKDSIEGNVHHNSVTATEVWVLPQDDLTQGVGIASVSVRRI
jgi:hypothetical protein